MFELLVTYTEALLTSGCFADGSADGKVLANSTPAKAAYQSQRKVTLMSNRYFHQSYKFFRCVSVDIMRSCNNSLNNSANSGTSTSKNDSKNVSKGSKRAPIQIALFSFYFSGGQSTRDFTISAASSTGSVGVSKGFIYSVECTDPKGVKLVYQVIPRKPLHAGLMNSKMLASSEHIPSTLTSLKLVSNNVFVIAGSNGFVGVCVQPKADAQEDEGVIAGGANGIIECDVSEDGGSGSGSGSGNGSGSALGGGHAKDTTVIMICASDSCSMNDSGNDSSSSSSSNSSPRAVGARGGLFPARVNRGIYFCTADNKGGLVLWQLHQEFASSSSSTLDEDTSGGSSTAVPARAKGIMCSAVNINQLKCKSNKPPATSGRVFGGSSSSHSTASAGAVEVAVSMQFICNDNYLLVTTSTGRVLLLGVNKTQASSVSDTLLAGVAPATAKRLSLRSSGVVTTGGTTPTVTLNTWTVVELTAVGGLGTTPPPSLSAVSNTGASRPTRVWLALERYTEGDCARVRVIQWKVTMNSSGNSPAASNNAIVCKRQVLPDSVLLFAVAKLMPVPSM